MKDTWDWYFLATIYILPDSQQFDQEVGFEPSVKNLGNEIKVAD